MITLRKSCQRGYADHGWLKSFHSFSFANYFDPEQMGWGNLRVINEDRVAPGTGFGTHGHRDMEILSVVLEGELAHKDSLGHGTSIRPGEVQRMSAGRGVMHSEFNHAPGQDTHFLQIWIEPSQRGIDPGYEQKAFDADPRRGRLQCVAGPEDDAAARAAGAVVLHADARVHLGDFDGDEAATLTLAPGRLAYVHLIAGRLSVDEVALSGGDGAKVSEQRELRLHAGEGARAIVFDLGPAPGR